MWFLLLLIVPIVALLVLGFVLSAILAVAVAVVAYLLPVLLIAAGCWLLARALGWTGRRDRSRDDARAHRQARRYRSDHAPAAQPSQQQRHAAPTAAMSRRQLPIDAQVKAEQIHHKVQLLLGYADRFPPFSQDLYLVRQISADYLPRTNRSS